MKVLILNGSPRVGGNTTVAVEEMERIFREEGVEVETVQVGAREVAVDLYIVVEYGLRIPDVALQVQEKVKEAVETATGLTVLEINVHVQGVGFSRGDTDEDLRVR